MLTGVIAALIVVVIGGFIAARASKRAIATATGGAPDGFGFAIAPAPPLPEKLAEVRALLGETASAVKFTRYTRPIVTADRSGIGISAAKTGLILGIPASAVTAIEARPMTMKPKGTLIATTWPTVFVRVRNGDVETEIGLTPITGLYDKVSVEHAHSLALQLHAKLFGAPAA